MSANNEINIEQKSTKHLIGEDGKCDKCGKSPKPVKKYVVPARNNRTKDLYSKYCNQKDLSENNIISSLPEDIDDKSLSFNDSLDDPSSCRRRKRKRKKSCKHFSKCHKHGHTVTKSYVKNIGPDAIRPKRAGVIPYTKIDNIFYFCLGIDSRHRELTELAGGVSYSTDFNWINGAIREFREESLGIFENLTVDDVKNSPVIFDEYNSMILYQVENVDPQRMCDEFLIRYNQQDNAEVCAIVWIPYSELHKILNRSIGVYSKTCNLLFEANDFSYLL